MLLIFSRKSFGRFLIGLGRPKKLKREAEKIENALQPTAVQRNNFAELSCWWETTHWWVFFFWRRTCSMIEQAPNSFQLCDWTDSNTVTNNYHRWWGCNKRDNLRRVNTKRVKPQGQPHLRRFFFLTSLLTCRKKLCTSKRSKQDLCRRFGSDVLQEDKGEICSLVTDVSLAWGPCTYF